MYLFFLLLKTILEMAPKGSHLSTKLNGNIILDEETLPVDNYCLIISATGNMFGTIKASAFLVLEF